MDKLTLNNIIESYQYDKYFFESIEEYLEFNNVPKEDFKLSIFRIKVIENMNNKAEKIKELTELFNNCTAFKSINKDNERYIIYHPATKQNNNKYQLSFFDKLGAFSDIARDNIKDIIEEFYNYSKEYNNIVEIVR